MQRELFTIGGIPALLLGEPGERVCLFIHGQSGSKSEAEAFAETAAAFGYQVLGVDLPGHGARDDSDRFLPWIAVPELTAVLDYAAHRWAHVSVRANSIGAWFSTLAFSGARIDRCLFVSPVLDMERLILNMMRQADVTEERLQRERTIAADGGAQLDYEYLLYVRQHAVASWPIPTSILYASGDALIERAAVDAFCARFGCDLTVMEGGEHWFHTPEQLDFLRRWEYGVLRRAGGEGTV